MADDWYSIHHGSDLEQGDLLIGCPVFVPQFSYPVREGNARISLPIYDLVILTQSCDLVEGQKVNVKQVVVCAAPLISKLIEVENSPVSNQPQRDALAKFGLVGLHPLPAFNSAQLVRPYSAVLFGQVFALPLDYVRKFADASGPRLRLEHPYRELLAQKFGYYFSRVGLRDRLTPPSGNSKT